jgi:hypothetical protein
MALREEDFLTIDQFLTQSALVEPVITAQNLSSIYQCPDQQMYRARIQFLFSLNQWAYEEATRDALIDMMHGAILFASDNHLPYPKAIIFLSIYMRVFQAAISSPYYRPEELRKQYEHLLLSHSVDRPPFAAAIFELADVKIINDFFVNTFFRNVKIVLHCFTPKPVLEFKAVFPVRVKVPELPPLADMEMATSPPPEEDFSAKDELLARAKSLYSPRERMAHPQPGPAEVRPAPKPTKEAPPQQQQQPEQPEALEDRGPEVPIDALRGPLAAMHEKFVAEFEERERQLLGKIKEFEIRLAEKPQFKKPPPKKK